jgi:pyruvate formate lyase activating enzyme
MRDRLVGAVTWKPTTLNDYPGKVATILFFPGCNLRCPYCHNPHIVHPDPEKLRAFVPEEFWAHLEKRKGAIRGVVFSGGEPTLHPEIKEAFADIRSMGFAIKLDTNGMLPDVAESFAPDYLALDVKTRPSAYRSLLKAPFDDIERRLTRSIALARTMGERAEIRITVAPGIVDELVIREICELIRGMKKAFLQPMQQGIALLDPSFERAVVLPIEEIRRYRDILRGYVERCEIRGE